MKAHQIRTFPKKFVNLLRDPRAFRIAIVILILILLICLIYKFQPWNNFEKIVKSMQGMGLWGPFAYLVVVVIAFILPPAPDLVLVAASGLAFGSLLGTVYTIAGALIGGTTSFYLARYLGRPLLERYLGKKRMNHIDRYVAKMGWGLLFITRLIPGFNFSFVSLAAGLTEMSLTGFLSATLLGALPIFIIVSSSGHALPGRPVLFLAGIAVFIMATAVSHRIIAKVEDKKTIQ